MANTEEVDFETGEVKEAVDIDVSALTLITKADIDTQISTAKRYPRDLQKVKRRMWELIGQDAETAKDCIYALPRGREKNEQTGKWEQRVVTGPTVRFAEAMVSAWGNSRCGARIVNEEQEFLTAQGVYHDLETNVVINFEVRRRITDREGRRYNADMVTVSANAACSTALRNAILRGIPQQIWKPAYTAAQGVIKGDIKTLAERRAALVDQFRAFAMTGPMVAQVLGVSSQSEISLDHLVVLQGMLVALQDGDTTVEQLMSDALTGDTNVAAKGKQTIEGIKKQYQKPQADETSPDIRKMAEAAQVKLQQKRQETKAGEPTKASEITQPDLGADKW